MINSRLYLDIHVLQTVPPSCLNRDDTGSPKTAVYGGVTRARVSSQSWKKAIRDFFRDEIFAEEDIGVRTRHILNMVTNEIVKLGGSDPDTAAKSILKKIGKKGLDLNSKKEFMTDVPLFLSIAQAKALAKIAVENPEADKKTIQAAFKEQASVDIALFGRMVADDPSLNTDACSQVAHSISTHKVNNEYDYFTAVDDLAPEDNVGAMFIGSVEYNSSTLYRYATVAVHELVKILENDTSKAITAFTDAFIRSMPTGKQNTFANRTLPDAVLITIRTDQPINLVGAFEKPIQSGGNGYKEASIKAMVKHTKETYAKWLDAPEVTFVMGSGLDELGEPESLGTVLGKLRMEIDARTRQE